MCSFLAPKEKNNNNTHILLQVHELKQISDDEADAWNKAFIRPSGININDLKKNTHTHTQQDGKGMPKTFASSGY